MLFPLLAVLSKCWRELRLSDGRIHDLRRAFANFYETTDHMGKKGGGIF